MGIIENITMANGLALPMLFYIMAAAVLGLVIGSFLNVVIVRLPPLLAHRWACTHQAQEGPKGAPSPPSLVKPRSHCPKCQHPIAWYDNIPLVSWILLRAQCRHCKARISARYPLIELLTAAIFVVVILTLGPTIEGVAALVFSGYLIAATAIDIDHHILPDGLTLSILWLGLLFNASTQAFVSPTDAIWGAAAGYGFLWLIFHGFYQLTGREGLGFGDLKLLAGIGAWVGWMALPFVLFLASVLGVLFGIVLIARSGGDRQQPIAFGPYLALAGWVALLWGDAILALWLGW